MATMARNSRLGVSLLRMMGVTLLLAAFAMVSMPPCVACARTPTTPQKPQITIYRAATGVLTLKEGSTYHLNGTPTEGDVWYTSSDPDVVSIASYDLLKAEGVGTATVTVHADNRGATNEKTVRVTVVKSSDYKSVKSISAQLARERLGVGQSTRVRVVFEPWDASNKNVTMQSDNIKVASVKADGTVVTRSVGTAQITVKSCSNDYAQATVRATVGEKSSKDDETNSALQSLGGWWQSGGSSGMDWWHIVGSKLYMYGYQGAPTFQGKCDISLTRFEKSQSSFLTDDGYQLRYTLDDGRQASFIYYDDSHDFLTCANLDGSGYSGSSSRIRVQNPPSKLVAFARNKEG